jgi:archaemetzincin
MTGSHKRVLLLGSLFGGVGMMVGAGFWQANGEGHAPELTAIRAAARKIKPLHARMGKPRAGEWLAEHHEDGQTFDEYLASNPNRPTRRRTTIYIQPLGDFNKLQARLVDDTVDLMSRFFSVPVKKLPPLGLNVIPARARRTHPSWGMKQILSTYVLNMLKPRRPRDAVAVLALTSSDLWPGRGWNFVFGQASLSQRVGVWSLYRNGDPAKNYTLCLLRTLKTALHETGHMLGMQHCIAYDCGMNGSNHQEESDRRPLVFCPECEAKIWWACRTDPVRRYRRLLEFAEARGLKKEAAMWKASLAALRR